MVAIAAALVTQPMRAGAIDTLVITENSSTSLTAILNGNPLTVTFLLLIVGLLPRLDFLASAQASPGRSQTLRALLTS